MASRFTYDQFQQAAQNSGLLGQFSQGDLDLALRNPDAGMSILTAKQDYANAATDEQRALANHQAEAIRASYGNYTGGKDGGGFTLTPLSPGSFSYDKAPSYTGQYDGDVKDLWEQQKNYGSFTYGDAPVYNNRYDGTIQDMIQGILNREDFSYDPATDQLYQNYRKQYTREGQRATQDALGAAAAASGGMPSSYAGTAAGQAGNYYAAQMTDKIPELYELAYNKYLNDYNMQLSDLGVVQGAEQSDYDKYLNQLSQYNTDRNFDYSAWLDQYNMLSNNLQTAQGMSQSDYDRYLTSLDQYNTDREFAYGQLLDEINSQSNERSEALNNAILAGEYGDYSFLNGMGINTDNNPTDWERRYELAQLAAQYGDLSGLQALGIDTSAYRTGSRSSGGSGQKKSSMTLSVAKQYADNGIWNEDVLSVFHDSGYSDELLAAMYGYEPAGGGGGPAETEDDKMITVPGYGRLLYEDAERLIEQGYITVTGTDENGNPILRRTGKKQTENIAISR